MIKWLIPFVLVLPAVNVKGRSAPCDSSIHVPNTVSPNGDSVNDCLAVRFTGKVPAHYEFSIYNRWGELVYETTDPHACWDTNNKKNPCPVGVYVWMIKYQFGTQDEKRTCTGNVVIVR